MPAKPRDHAIAVAAVLDLQHHALVGFIADRCWLGDHTIESGPFKPSKPIRGRMDVASSRGQVQWRFRRVENSLEFTAPQFEGLFTQIAAAFAQQIEEDDGRGSLFGQFLYAGGSRVNAKLEN